MRTTELGKTVAAYRWPQPPAGVSQRQDSAGSALLVKPALDALNQAFSEHLAPQDHLAGSLALRDPIMMATALRRHRTELCRLLEPGARVLSDKLRHCSKHFEGTLSTAIALKYTSRLESWVVLASIGAAIAVVLGVSSGVKRMTDLEPQSATQVNLVTFFAAYAAVIVPLFPMMQALMSPSAAPRMSLVRRFYAHMVDHPLLQTMIASAPIGPARRADLLHARSMCSGGYRRLAALHAARQATARGTGNALRVRFPAARRCNR